MGRYVLRRLVWAVPLLLGISVIVFLLLRVGPGGPLAAYEASPDVTPADIQRLEHEFGLDQPLPLQYLQWLAHFVTGDWGYSIAQHLPVTQLITERLVNTVYLMTAVYVLTIVIAIPIGLITAVKQYSKTDNLISALTFIGYSTPTFWLGLLLIVLFGLELRWLPLGGVRTPGASGFDPVDSARHLVLPVATLSLVGLTRYVRFLRASMLETINQDYLRTARAKGLAERVVILRHAFKNAAIPLVTIAALDLPELFGGALVTEQIFGWPGMGRLFWDATTRLDYPILMGILFVSAALIVLANLIADVLYGYLDPRIRFA